MRQLQLRAHGEPSEVVELQTVDEPTLNQEEVLAAVVVFLAMAVILGLQLFGVDRQIQFAEAEDVRETMLVRASRSAPELERTEPALIDTETCLAMARDVSDRGGDFVTVEQRQIFMLAIGCRELIQSYARSNASPSR